MNSEAYVKVAMPYIPELSVNSAYRRGSPRFGKVDQVSEWLELFRQKLDDSIDDKIPAIGDVRMDLSIKRRKKRGRKPDVANFRKIPMDVAAEALGVDDVVFWGYDNPLETSDQDQIVVELWWDYEITSNAKGIRRDTKRAFGPLTSDYLWSLFGLKKGEVCIGFGSAYCFRCSDNPSRTCPYNYSPEVYEKVPCRECEVAICPCRGNDEGYEERKKRIVKWWKAREASVGFERENWD